MIELPVLAAQLRSAFPDIGPFELVPRHLGVDVVLVNAHDQQQRDRLYFIASQLEHMPEWRALGICVVMFASKIGSTDA